MTRVRVDTAVGTGLVGIGAFQAALAAGAPWGRAAYGGSHQGRLPDRFRAVSAVTAVGYTAGGALLAGGAGSPSTRQRAMTGIAALMGVATLVNGASRSPVERAIWTPYAATLGVLAWKARRAAA